MDFPPENANDIAHTLFRKLSDMNNHTQGVTAQEFADEIKAIGDDKIKQKIHTPHDENTPCHTILIFNDTSLLDIIFVDGMLTQVIVGNIIDPASVPTDSDLGKALEQAKVAIAEAEIVTHKPTLH